MDHGATAHLSALAFYDTALDPEATTALVDTPHLSAIERLDIDGCRLGNEGLDLIAGAHHTLPSLRALSLRNARIGLLSLRALGDSPLAGALTHLDLSDNHLGRAGAEALASAPTLGALRSLRIKKHGPWHGRRPCLEWTQRASGSLVSIYSTIQLNRRDWPRSLALPR